MASCAYFVKAGAVCKLERRLHGPVVVQQTYGRELTVFSRFAQSAEHSEAGGGFPVSHMTTWASRDDDAVNDASLRSAINAALLLVWHNRQCFPCSDVLPAPQLKPLNRGPAFDQSGEQLSSQYEDKPAAELTELAEPQAELQSVVGGTGRVVPTCAPLLPLLCVLPWMNNVSCETARLRCSSPTSTNPTFEICVDWCTAMASATVHPVINN